ncbi:PepSY domain-containing protein [Rhodoplanes sp. Z2-YC6860]|uniref:PepSY domain-containing protein n=1 Tax=Rhodoplanes sp. Z2-YC6860 TaxID=674703 RepID=UPI00083109C9|nr:PepSY domain-containing protein [Rhodoplanes sp. Z2-YC6860]
MRTLLSAAAIASLIGFASPALADFAPGGSVHRAVETARSFGMVGFNEIQYFDGKWEIQGRDIRGKDIHMDVDAITGAVIKVDRD